MVRGSFQYHAGPGNEQRLRSFPDDVLQLLGCASFGGEVNGATGPGSVSWSGFEQGSQQSRSYTLGQTGSFCGHSSKVRTVCVRSAKHGSVQGAVGNRCPYRDPHPRSKPGLSEYSMRLNRLNSICLVLLLVAPICAQESKPRFYRVDDNVYRGKQPTKQDIPKLSAMGVKIVLDLRERASNASCGSEEPWRPPECSTFGSGFQAPWNRLEHAIDKKILALLGGPNREGLSSMHTARAAWRQSDRSGNRSATESLTIIGQMLKP